MKYIQCTPIAHSPTLLNALEDFLKFNCLSPHPLFVIVKHKRTYNGHFQEFWSPDIFSLNYRNRMLSELLCPLNVALSKK